MTRIHRLSAVAVVLAAILVILVWPVSEPIPGTRLDAAQIGGLPDATVVATVTGRLSQRAASGMAGWRRLPKPGQHVYVLAAFMTACDKYGLADQAIACAVFPDAPGFSDAAEACRAVVASVLAGVLDEAIEQVHSQSEALQAWQAYRSATDAGAKAPPDPLAACEARLRGALAAARLEDALRTYIRAHASELADP